MSRPLRVVVSGSECTGKTALASSLAARLGAPWVPEFARAYAEARGGLLGPEDVEPIARGQRAAEDEAEARAGGLLVLDTDLVSTAVYARHYYGACPEWVEAEARMRRGDLYLLCHPDLPWRPDGVRDRERAREGMHALFAAALAALGVPVVDVRGQGASREEAALAAVAALAARQRGTRAR